MSDHMNELRDYIRFATRVPVEELRFERRERACLFALRGGKCRGYRRGCSGCIAHRGGEWSDHLTVWKDRHGRLVAIVGQPYQLRDADYREMFARMQATGTAVSVGNAPMGHHPREWSARWHPTVVFTAEMPPILPAFGEEAV